MGVTMLTREFFEYFARKFPWDTHIVSVTSPGLVPKVCVCQEMSRCARLYLGMYGYFWVCGSRFRLMQVCIHCVHQSLLKYTNIV